MMAYERGSSFAITGRYCETCGSEIAPSLLVCPSCHWLVHEARLKQLAEVAEAAEMQGDLAPALAFWRDAACLLPQDSRQYAIIGRRIARLGRRVEAAPFLADRGRGPKPGGAQPDRKSRFSGGVVSGIIGTIALAAWKLKSLVLLIMTKGKIVLLGLTNSSTFLSMLATVGVYWATFGGWLALGLVLSIYLHEMGHVVALLRYGGRASAPLFIPGLGAFIRLSQPLIDPKQDARVALAGPIWGLAAALFCGGVFALTRQPIWAALAQLGALINLFNLLPLWQLDGARAFRSLNRSQQWLAVASIAAAWVVTDQWLLVLLLIAAAVHTFADKPKDEPDAPILVQYAALIMVLSALSRLSVPLSS
jgi:Zn-dependent protease